VVTTLHTVLNKPSYNELHIVREIYKLSQRIIVMASKALELLRDVYTLPTDKVSLIRHGVPDIHYDRTSVKTELGFADKKLLCTFGFIGHNKGIEMVISALPSLIAQYPDVVYLILGKTHPNVIK